MPDFLRSTLSSIGAATVRLGQDRRGNILMIFAFALLPITFATGMGVDYAGAMRIQTKVNAVADAAALSGVNKTLMDTMPGTACYAARMMFTNQAPMTGLTLDATKASDLTIIVTDTPIDGSPDKTLTCPLVSVPDFVTKPSIKKRLVTVTWSGTSKNTFSGVLGMSTLPVHGTATATASNLPYVDVHMVLDTSQSMGLAASDADAAELWNRTKKYNGDGCTFGCHVAAPGKPYANEDLASNLAYGTPVKLRVNVLRDATADMVQSAIDAEGSNNTYRFGLYRIGRTLTTIPGAALTTNLPSVKTIVGGLKLGDNDSSGVGDTNLIDTMDKMYANIPVHGDGSTQGKARAFMFIVTDGVTDLRQDQASASAPGPNYSGCRSGHCTKPIDATTCQRYKDAGITVGIVYTTYLPVKADPLNPNSTALRSEYIDLIKAFSWPGYVSGFPSNNSPDIAIALQACASSGWYFEASDATTIHSSMQKLFAQAQQSAMLTH